MNYILLAGGTGERLWPLSHSQEGKQFLKILPTAAGTRESMLERTCRLIQSQDPQAHLVVAVGPSQQSLARAQVPQGAALCVEPARKDTFPAAVLAYFYGIEKAGMPRTEPVMICPVDHYVSASFYQKLQEIPALFSTLNCPLVLVGIEPDRPSGQYGYILPDPLQPSRVLQFVEKPDEETARTYIQAQGLWNAGVFGCAPDYLMRKARERLGCSSYEQLYERYPLLERISFDYALCETEPQMGLLRYQGVWKDIGTWNRLHTVLEEKQMGSVVTDSFSRTSLILNETPLPIVCSGCPDLVIVASAAGILISRREDSESIKPLVQQVLEHAA